MYCVPFNNLSSKSQPFKPSLGSSLNSRARFVESTTAYCTRWKTFGSVFIVMWKVVTESIPTILGPGSLEQFHLRIHVEWQDVSHLDSVWLATHPTAKVQVRKSLLTKHGFQHTYALSIPLAILSDWLSLWPTLGSQIKTDPNMENSGIKGCLPNRLSNGLRQFRYFELHCVCACVRVCVCVSLELVDCWIP